MMKGPNESPSSRTDPLVLQPTLFILNPLPPAEPVDVCLAAHFSPRQGEMVVNGLKQETSGAVMSHRHGSFFFAGFNRTIKDCKLQESSVSVDPGTGAIFIPLTVCLHLPQRSLLHPAGKDQGTDPELWTVTRRNLLLLQMNMLRVLLTKTVSLSTIVTIRALLH